MSEYKSLKVGVFEDERFVGLGSGSNGFSTKLEGYVSGVFNTARIYGAIAPAPDKIASLNNPKRFANLAELRHMYPLLTESVERHRDPKSRVIRDIRVYEAQLLDERVLSAFNGLPYTITTEDREKQPERTSR